MNRLAVSLIGLGVACAPVLLAAPANAGTVTPRQPVHAQSWNFNGDGSLTVARPGVVTPADLGVCRGTFEGPQKSNSSVETSTFIQCSEPAAVTASTALDKCVRNGGPDDFTCTTVARSHGSTSGKAYYLNVPVYYTCKTGQYRPRAYYQTVNGIEYPDVTGNVVTVTC